MYKYDFEKMTDTDLLRLGAANNLLLFFVWLTGILFNIYGFQIGFTGINYVFGLPYLLYFFCFTRTIISFVFKHLCYKKHNFFGNKKKYIIDTMLYALFLLAFFLHAYFLITVTSDNETFIAINWNYEILIPVLLPLSVIFWIYIDLTGAKAVRMKNKAYWKNKKVL